MDSQLVVLHFEDEDAADAALSSIQNLVAEGFVTLEDAAVLARATDGSVTARPASGGGVGSAVLGGVLGAVAGGLVGLPVLGAAVGAGLRGRHLAKHAERLDDLLFTVGERMAPGTAVLALLVSDIDDPGLVTDRLERHRGTMLHVEIPEALKAQMDRPEEQRG